ncbi:lipopolysaccharide biosynthesis protein [Enterococcus hailinensis]|uniref:lipopolysaccharide biosynthesis protein n=1 Tax=Enterococcus hailinensis TaxID=3238988 RepID=UPI0038B37D61
MKKSRLEYSLINSSISLFIYVIRLIIQFIARSFFINYLGAQYLGLNGLFNNILSFLSLAELGIGTSIVFSLYRPLAENDKKHIVSLMRLYKKAYEMIGVVIGILGMLIIPTLPFIIKDSNIEMHKVYMYYILFLINSVASYFFTYKRSLIIADQKNYLVVLNDFVFLLFMNIVQILGLYLFKNFAFFLIVQILFTLIGNISISIITDKKYPFLKSINPDIIEPELKQEIKKNVIGNMSSKLGGVIVMGTDNILISGFVGLTAVGIYSNYSLIIVSIQNLCKQITNSITASLGNFAVSGNKNRGNILYKNHLFINHTLVYFFSILTFSLINSFVSIWVGKNYLLPQLTVALIILNFIIQVYRNTNIVFIESFGLYWQQRYKPVIEAGLNLVVSMVLLIVFRMGINGVLIGTIISSICFVFWFELYIVSIYALETSIKNVLFSYLRYVMHLAFSIIIVSNCTKFLFINFDSNILTFLLKGLLSFLLASLLYVILYYRSNEFKFILDIVKKIFRR